MPTRIEGNANLPEARFLKNNKAASRFGVALFLATSKNVIPAKAGIQKFLTSPDFRFCGSDELIIIRGPLLFYGVLLRKDILKFDGICRIENSPFHAFFTPLMCLEIIGVVGHLQKCLA